MTNSFLLPDFISRSVERSSVAVALTYGKQSIRYAELERAIDGFVSGMLGLGLRRGERIAIYLEKRFETVIASFGATAAGCLFVPLNPLPKPNQIAYIQRDCNVRALVTSSERLTMLASALDACSDLRHVALVNAETPTTGAGAVGYLGKSARLSRTSGLHRSTSLSPHANQKDN